jgi:hypothetical protein
MLLASARRELCSSIDFSAVLYNGKQILMSTQRKAKKNSANNVFVCSIFLFRDGMLVCTGRWR